jgi:hypothetical protein
MVGAAALFEICCIVMAIALGDLRNASRLVRRTSAARAFLCQTIAVDYADNGFLRVEAGLEPLG